MKIVNKSIVVKIVLSLFTIFSMHLTWAQNQITIPPSGDNSSLKALASNCGLNMANLGDRTTAPDLEFEKILRNDFNMVGSENGMKMQSIKRSEASYDFTSPDRMIAYAKANNMKVRGHTIIWHNGLPGWMETKTWTRQSLLAFLKNYIQLVVERYKGEIDEWDVANEFINHKTGEGFRNGIDVTNGDGSIWIKYIGPEVLDSAFKWVHQIDPTAKLYYNDFGAEGMNKKSQSVYDLVKGMKERGVPIHGVGLQCHFKYDLLQTINAQNAIDIDQNIKRIGALGLQVSFTEIDLKIPSPVSSTAYYQQALSYGNLLQIALNNRSIVKTFMMWGITDKYSWILNNPGNFVDPLFYTGDYQKKPAYDQMVAVLKTNCPVNTAPEIQVKQGANSILNSTGKYDFTATVLVGNTSAPITFTIQNSGTATLNIGAITMAGTNPLQFVVTQVLDPTIANPTGSSTFTLQFKPTNAGAKTAIVSIANNDPNESPFTFVVNANTAITTNLEEESGFESLSIYPNPSKDGIFNLSKSINWKVYSMLGKELKSGNGNQVDISENPKGIYLIKMDDKLERVVVE